VTRLESTIRGTAEAGDWAPDWEDVLRRAGGGSRLRSTRAAAIGAAAAIALVLTLPGIGVGGRLTDLIVGSGGPGIELRAQLAAAGGRSVGTVSLRTSRIFVALHPPRRVEPRPLFVHGQRPGLPVPIRWSLDLEPGVVARSARIEDRRGSVIARLCAPCRNGAHGTAKIRARNIVAVFGRALAVVETSGGTVRGTLRLATPMR
jgi:hypothetical protein